MKEINIKENHPTLSSLIDNINLDNQADIMGASHFGKKLILGV